MEDLDGMIMDTLRKLDCSFCNETEALSLMGLDDIVEAIVKLLWACNSENQSRIPSYKLPHIMTAKYKTVTIIANAIKELGIREDVGYQNILYPNIFEIRQILISLIEKLPKQAIQTDIYKSPLEQLKSQIGEQIQEDFKQSRYPCYCRFLIRKEQNPEWHLKAQHPEFFSFSTAKSHDFRQKICSALDESAHLDFSTAELTFKQSDCGPKLIRKSVFKSASRAPPPIAPKPRISVEDKPSSNQLNLEKLQERNDLLKLEMEAKIEQLGDVNSLLNSLESEIKSSNAELGLKDEKLLQILCDPENQFASLQKFIDQAPTRQKELENTLEEWKAEHLPELERLRREIGAHSLSNIQLLEAQKRAEQLRRSISDQTHALNKLQKQANKDDLSELDSSERTKFLSRIMYLVKSVNAQKEEIMRSFLACQQLEKERRQLQGNLDRTFTVVNQWLGGTSTAEADAILRKSHNLLVRMHGQCDMITQSIEAIFNLNNESDEFQDQVELLTQHQVDSALDQILSDLLRVKQENDEIRTRLHGMR